ncbi:MAG: hypothetical protein ACK59C_08115 [Holosporales bacterium]
MGHQKLPRYRSHPKRPRLWSTGRHSGLNIAACLIMGGAAVHDIITLPYASAALWCKLAANILWLSIALNTKHEHLLNTMAAMVFLIMTVLLHDPLLVYIGVTGLMAASAGWAALSTK